MAPTSIEAMYPPVPVSLLVSELWQTRFREYFRNSGELEADPFEVVESQHRPQTKCISVCLFKKNVDNRKKNEYSLDENYWRTKYWGGLLGVIREMRFFRDWKLRIYTDPALWNTIPNLMMVHPQVEFCRMATESIGSCPGTLWRYLALADNLLEFVLATDIDELLIDKINIIQFFEFDDCQSIGRLGLFTCDHHYLVDPGRSRAKNYATILGGRVLSRPSRWGFDIAAAMRGFMAYRRYMSQTDRPWSYSETEQPSPYNEPVHGHIYGWGSHWYTYGFCERFLKHVIYYHFAATGSLQTWASSLCEAELTPEGACDLQYVSHRGNSTVSLHTNTHIA
jgi:hypothetical protein